MSLITRCPSCRTQFRVVADQLRISEGWVRCGRCQEVFDATQALQDAVQPAAPAPVAAPPAADTATPVSANASAVQDAAVTPVKADADAVDVTHPGYELPAPPEPAEHTLASWPWQAETVPPATANTAASSADAWLSAPLREILAPDAPAATASQDAAPTPAWSPVKAIPAEDAQALQWSQAWLAVKTVPAAAASPLDEEQTTAEAQGPDDDAALTLPPNDEQEAAAPVPSFVKQAQRKAWWSQPAVRFVMGMLVTLLPLALLLQIAIHERNHLVAWKPQWRPAFAAMCVALRCELAPRQHIASVVLTGSSFNQDAQANHYRLGLSIQNQSGASVATPAVELTLNDTQGQTLVRKVLMPAEIGAPLELAAHSEWNGSLPVVTQGLQLPVSGYRVLAFYP